MKAFAKIGTGPQEQIIIVSPRRPFHFGDMERTTRVKWKRPGRGEKTHIGLFRGWAGDGIQLEEWE